MKWFSTMFTSNDPIHCLEPTSEAGLSPVSTSACEMIGQLNLMHLKQNY